MAAWVLMPLSAAALPDGIVTVSVPEPGPLILMLTGVVGLVIAGRRRAR